MPGEPASPQLAAAGDASVRQAAEAAGLEPIHLAVAKLAHELCEALTAANGYLHASEHLESPSDLDAAIGKAIEQVNRAGDVIVRLPSVAGGP